MSFSNEPTLVTVFNSYIVSSRCAEMFHVKVKPLFMLEYRLVKHANSDEQKKECQPYYYSPFTGIFKIEENNSNYFKKIAKFAQGLIDSLLIAKDKNANVEKLRITYQSANSVYFSQGGLHRVFEIFLYYYFLYSTITLTYASKNILINHIFNPLLKSPIDYTANYHFLLVLLAFVFTFYRKWTQQNSNKVERKYYERNAPDLIGNSSLELGNSMHHAPLPNIVTDSQPNIVATDSEAIHVSEESDSEESTSEVFDEQATFSDQMEILALPGLATDSEAIHVSEESDSEESTSEVFDEETFIPIERPNYSDDDDDDGEDDNVNSATFQSDSETDLQEEKNSSEEALKQLLFKKESCGKELNLNGSNKNKNETSIALTSEIELETFPGFFAISALQWQSDLGTQRVVFHLENQFIPLMLGAILHNIVLPICSLFSTRLFFSFLLSFKVVQFPIELLYSYTNNFWLAKNCFILFTQMYIYCLYSKEKKSLQNHIYFLADRCAKNLIVGFLLSHTIFPFFYDLSIINNIQILLMVDLFF